VVIGSNYSIFGKGKSMLQAVRPEESNLLTYGASNIVKGYTDMVVLGQQSLADSLLPKKLREGREKEIIYCTTCDNCLELLIRQRPIGCCTYNKYYINVLVKTRKEMGRLEELHT
jgi:hypothetical protein